MSEFEVAILTNEFVNSLQGRIETYLLGLFAMLIATYFIAAKLSRMMAILLVSLFSLYCVALGYATYTCLWRVGVLVRNYNATSSEPFPWLLDLPGFSPVIAIPAMLIGAYSGAIWFFFYARSSRFE